MDADTSDSSEIIKYSCAVGEHELKPEKPGKVIPCSTVYILKKIRWETPSEVVFASNVVDSDIDMIIRHGLGKSENHPVENFDLKKTPEPRFVTPVSGNRPPWCLKLRGPAPCAITAEIQTSVVESPVRSLWVK